MPKNWREIVSNLLSNAIKFTEKNGQVKLWVDLTSTKNLSNLIITVTDTGIGIPKEKLPLVFDRFYQTDDDGARKSEGTGIGLALTKELVKLLGGEISVKSEVGKGTAFEVRLPVTNAADFRSTTDDLKCSPTDKAAEVASSSKSIIQNGAVAPLLSTSEQILLVVEDNPDVVRYLQSFLPENYRIEVATDGQQGIEKAIQVLPDIIISDVMMPKVDGFQLCDTLKKDERTNHIPIILLTAKADAASRIEGLEHGADEYLTKPFDKEELLVRLRKMVEMRKTLHEHFANGIEQFLIGDRRAPAEDEFIKKLLKVLEDHYADEDFDISELYHALHMSRAQCYRKIRAITGMPVADLLKDFRLQKAKILLATTDLSISQVALDVGYKNLSHFSRSFTSDLA
ncbi:MAG: response regulator [Saprospiraceae bacterium]|nr:response regulator [Saprospiraceae bacterium]